jgi:hypothetical protein
MFQAYRALRAKKPAKLLLFFELTKYFGKKNQKMQFLHDLFGILAHYACIKWVIVPNELGRRPF